MSNLELIDELLAALRDLRAAIAEPGADPQSATMQTLIERADRAISLATRCVA